VWQSAAGAHGYGGFESWSGAVVEADDMVNYLVSAMSLLMPNGVHYDNAVIYTVATPSSPAIPKVVVPLAQVGGISSPGWTRAVQRTMTFFDSEFNTAKLVLLDADSADLFTEVIPAGMSANELSLAAAYCSSSWAWQSRAGFRPVVPRTLSTTINVKLRDSYVV
jgi:hypothetical protein